MRLNKAVGVPNRQAVCILFGIIGLTLMLWLPAPGGLSPAGWTTAAVGILIAFWWVTEAIPLATTALLPLVIFPLLGIAKIEEAAASYAHPLIFLFLGGFMMARAIEKSGLSFRIAVQAVRLAGGQPGALIAALMGTTAFLSMWISNTATAMVMMPIAASILAGSSAANDNTPINDQSGPEDQMGPALLLGIAYAATIGGMASLIGTPPNALFAGFMSDQYGIKVGFAEWMLIGLPVAIILLPITWFLLVKVIFTVGPNQPNLQSSLEHHGTIKASLAEWRVGSIVALAAAFWLLRPAIEAVFPGLALSDTGIAISAAVLLLVVPDGTRRGTALLSWEDAVQIRWDVLILFGGGLALAAAIGKSGLAGWIGGGLSELGSFPLVLMILTIAVVIVYLGELASNTAMAAIFLPIGGATAIAMGESPLLLTLPIALSASIGFMLPVATPPNAIVFGTGQVTSRQMLIAGGILDPISIIVAVASAMTLGYWVLGLG